VVPTDQKRSGNKAACRECLLRIDAGDAGVAQTIGIAVRFVNSMILDVLSFFR
jgi:hypothetical protein